MDSSYKISVQFRGLGVVTSFTAGTYKPVVVVTITEGSHPAVVAR